MLKIVKIMMISFFIFGAPMTYQAHSRCFTFTVSLNANNIPII